MAGALLLCSGGPDGDSRGRAPLAPLIWVIAAQVLVGRTVRRGTGRAFQNLS
ncbi:MAG TPA: hypothetical protein VKA59_14575 [Vicinamibacterales bacterium]|nr:hypothetical protein [Vicinamibacterales bacterium]